MKPEFIPLEEFLTKDIKPEEFITYLDAIEHECSMQLIEHPERADNDIIGGLRYLHHFRKVLEKL